MINAIKLSHTILCLVKHHDNGSLFVLLEGPWQKERISNLKWSVSFTSQGHSSFITHLDWSVDSQYLVSNSGDYEILNCEYDHAELILLQS